MGTALQSTTDRDDSAALRRVMSGLLVKTRKEAGNYAMR